MSYHEQLNKTDRIVGVLLAGGQSLRMNREDKYFKTLDSKTLLSYAIDRLSPQVDKLVLNVNEERAEFKDLGLPVAPDEVTGFAGPLAGVHAAMRWVQAYEPGVQYMVSVATDTPFFPKDLVSDMTGALSGAGSEIVFARSGGRVHPVFGLWPVVLADDLEAALEDGVRKVRAWAERFGVVYVNFSQYSCGDQEIDPFFNVNTPEDLSQAEGYVRELSSFGML